MLRTMDINFLPAVRDIILSKADKLPTSLVFDPSSKDGGSIISFIVNASDELLEDLSKAVRKKKSDVVQLAFFAKSDEKSLAKEIAPGKLSEYIDKCYEVEVNSTLAPYQAYAGTPPIYYVGIVFHAYF